MALGLCVQLVHCGAEALNQITEKQKQKQKNKVQTLTQTNSEISVLYCVFIKDRQVFVLCATELHRRPKTH